MESKTVIQNQSHLDCVFRNHRGSYLLLVHQLRSPLRPEKEVLGHLKGVSVVFPKSVNFND
jgi:hypothetical protein